MTKDREPGSMDYYGVTITSMFIFYGLIFISTYIIGEKRLKTKDRIMISPVKSVTYQWGVISGNVIILLLQTLFLIFLGIVVFNTYWGDNLLIPIGILTAELIMVSSLGALLGMLIDSESVVSGISQLLIPVFVFLGDGYVQLPSTGIFGVIKKFSPLYWVNHSIFNAIYSSDYSDAYIAIIICLSIAVISTIIIAIHRRSRRVANA
jgi:ABC-2 type transport system permease protein